MGSIQTITSYSHSLSSNQSIEPLERPHNLKTLDIGLDGSTVSTNSFGDKLLDYVYSGERGFGIHLEGTISDLDFNIAANNIIVTYSLGRLHVTTTISVCKIQGVIHSTVLKSNSTQTIAASYTFALDISVNRASYGQLTEGGPIPIPPLRNEFQVFDESRTWAIVNRNLDAMIQGRLYCNGSPICLQPLQEESIGIDKPVNMTFHGLLDINPGQTYSLVSTYRLQPGTNFEKLPSPLKTVSPSRAEYWTIKNKSMSLIVKGNLSYILGNCTIPVSNNSICLITDHIRYLLDIHQNINRLTDTSTTQAYLCHIQSVVRQHLNWVFRIAQRPFGYWHRSYLVTGVPKDRSIFQLDQQCYPILELCDFLAHFPSQVDFVKSILNEETVTTILSILNGRQDPVTRLYPTEETPGDDAVEHPFHFSSHILLWHTFSRLANTLSTLGYASDALNPGNLNQKAEQIRTATLQHFVARNPTTQTMMFAYLTDGAGTHTFYHDANDLPTLFIPSWGFASPSSHEHALWTRTMDFGLSPANTEGFFPKGPYGGLGSVHTRGPWPLGFAQELIFANLVGNRAAAMNAWRRVQGSMFMDGLFSEAVDAETGECTSKAWFSWPGSVIGSALLKFGVPGKGEA
ncbi:hypothetical protein N431DRAFT_506983 [Stipitochalara longipes BDJ]|nr:hypothetical protein N431DRAFT_506983 [Stipitochalara longipes BDJ]